MYGRGDLDLERDLDLDRDLWREDLHINNTEKNRYKSDGDVSQTLFYKIIETYD